MDNRIPTFDRWKAHWVIDVSYNKYLYDRKIYTWDGLVALHKEIYNGQ